MATKSIITMNLSQTLITVRRAEGRCRLGSPRKEMQAGLTKEGGAGWAHQGGRCRLGSPRREVQAGLTKKAEQLS